MSPWATLTVAAALVAAPLMASAADPVAVPAPQMRVGDSWVFDRTIERGNNGFMRGRKDVKIESIDGDTMVVGVKPDGAPVNFEDHMGGLDWSQRRIINGKEEVTGRPFSFPLTIGKTWTTDYVDSTPHGAQQWAHFVNTYRVVGWEDVTTPAGVFHALKITKVSSVNGHMAASASAVAGGAVTNGLGATASQVQRLPERDVQETWRDQLYYAPQVKYFVKFVDEHYNAAETRILRETETLFSYSVQP